MSDISDKCRAEFNQEWAGVDVTPEIMEAIWQGWQSCAAKQRDEVSLPKPESFEEACRPLIKWLNKNGHPHTIVVIDQMNAQFYESHKSFTTEEYLKD